jgi:hypothetical protein
MNGDNHSFLTLLKDAAICLIGEGRVGLSELGSSPARSGGGEYPVSTSSLLCPLNFVSRCRQLGLTRSRSRFSLTASVMASDGLDPPTPFSQNRSTAASPTVSTVIFTGKRHLMEK